MYKITSTDLDGKKVSSSMRLKQELLYFRVASAVREGKSDRRPREPQRLHYMGLQWPTRVRQHDPITNQLDL